MSRSKIASAKPITYFCTGPKIVFAAILLAAVCGCGARVRNFDEGVYFIEGRPGTPNQMVVDTSFGPVVADARVNPHLTDDLNARIAEQTGWRDAAYLINTSGLPYRWLTNYRYSRAEIVASSRTQKFMKEHAGDFLKDLDKIEEKPAWAGEITPVFPTLHFESSMSLKPPEGTIKIFEMPAGIVPGNTVVFLPHKGILYTGDLATSGTAPILEYADVSGWLKAIDEMKKLPVKKIIPGFGSEQEPAFLDRVAKAVRAIEAYDGGDVPAAVSGLWRDDPGLKQKLSDYIQAKGRGDAPDNYGAQNGSLSSTRKVSDL